MAGFKCPFCGQFMSVDNSTHKTGFEAFKSADVFHGPYLTVEFYHCPNESCNQETIVISGKNGCIENKIIQVYPDSNAIKFPDYIPPAIRSDYEEACSILRKSPKASATLARRCLQGMIRDFWKISKGRLVDEIKELQGKIPAAQWAAIDALRSIGNIGAHMEKDVNLIVDVDPDEAESLLKLIELLMEKWYINRHDEQQLYNSITTLKESKKSVKNSPPSDQ